MTMYYIEDQDPILVKNEVRLDRDQLGRLYQEIAARFGMYVHQSYDGCKGPYQDRKVIDQEFRYIKSYEETPGADADSRHYEFDEYRLPKLNQHIRRLLDGEVSAIDDIRKEAFWADVNEEPEDLPCQSELQAYYDQVLACIHFKPVATFYKDKLKEYIRIRKEVKQFFEGTDGSPKV